MKTKFDSVVKLKKQNVDKIQNDIQKINKAILELSEKTEELRSSLLRLTIPKSGLFSKITQINTQKSFIRNEIKNLQNQIQILASRKKELFNELKSAKIEYEKMKYLQGEEIKKKLKELKLKESREMDEIAILLRNQNESR